LGKGLLWAVFRKNYRSNKYFWATLFQGTSYVPINFDKKMGWATFWATFSQPLLVTLKATSEK
jgi:hypothetical protein